MDHFMKSKGGGPVYGQPGGDMPEISPKPDSNLVAMVLFVSLLLKKVQIY